MIELSDNALSVLKQRYFREDEDWEGLVNRVCDAICPEMTGIRELMLERKFLPNTPALINAGKEHQQLFACFVLPIEDSMESIFTTIKNMALIQKSGGGTGFDFSNLRERGAHVASTNGESSGVVSFMDVFNSATNSIKQGGVRRGANMAVLNVHHPEIIDFIKCKDDTTKLTNFNISVALTDEFMNAVKEGKCYNVYMHGNQEPIAYDANNVFEIIAEQAHKNGEPGVIFIDEINKYNPTPSQGKITATNPCGEQPLLPYESCVLGSIDVAKFFNSENSFDWTGLEEAVRIATDFLNCCIDKNDYPLPEIKEATLRNRKIGLGIMGWADLLYQMEIPYDSKEALDMAEGLMSTISFEAKNAGKTNVSVTTIAPTGSISIIADTSSGIEPNFALSYTRRTDTGLTMQYTNKYLEDYLSQNNLTELDCKGKDIFVTAQDISPEWHIKMQAAFQKYTDNAISKTINLPSNATVEHVKEAFLLAHELKCKGLTVYRDGSRSNQILSTKEEPILDEPRDRPEVTVGKTVRIPTACGNLYVTMNQDTKGICEIFAQMGKGGNCIAAQLEAIARLVSLALRSRINIPDIVKQLDNIKCTNTIYHNGKKIYSCADAIASVLKGNELDQAISKHKGICPECQEELTFQEGCLKCLSCGWSKC